MHTAKTLDGFSVVRAPKGTFKKMAWYKPMNVGHMDWKDLLLNDQQFELHWQMNHCERLALISILRKLRPQLAVEVGTYKGGSLQVIAKYSEKVITLDIDPEVLAKLANHFNNVEFLTGDSKETLPRLIRKFNESDDTPDFVLLDSTHSTEGIKREVEALLKLRPNKDVVVLLHDSFNPDCRLGMTMVDWESSPYVHYVEIDFIPGGFNARAYDTAVAGSMWSGFACAIMKPKLRTGGLIVQESPVKNSTLLK